MSRPHVAYVTPIFGYPAFGGPRLRTYNTVRALAQVADVSLYLTQQPDTLDRDQALAHLSTFCRDVVFPEPIPRASLMRRVANRARRALGLRIRANTAITDASGTATRVRLTEWLGRSAPDVLWLGFGGISYHLVSLKEQIQKPLVIETECVWSRFILRELPFESNADRREEILREGRAKEEEERSGALRADITTVVSEVDAEYFRSIAADPERVMLLSNVIDVGAYAENAESVRLQQPALLFAGTFSAGTANVDAALWLLDEIMPIVWRNRPDVHLYLVGRSPTAAVLARRGRHVHVTGEVASIVPYMRASAAALVPLRWESGTRFKILEAFACRTPVVSTGLGAEGLEVEHNRHLLLADEPDTFASAILALLDGGAASARMVEAAYELVRREYDISAAARQIEAILGRVCGFGSPHPNPLPGGEGVTALTLDKALAQGERD